MQAIGDPEELERFAAALQRFLDQLADSLGALNAEFSALGDTWQDGQRARFEEVYEDLRRQLAHFEENAGEQIPHLRQLAARLRDYMQT